MECCLFQVFVMVPGLREPQLSSKVSSLCFDPLSANPQSRQIAGLASSADYLYFRETVCSTLGADSANKTQNSDEQRV